MLEKSRLDRRSLFRRKGPTYTVNSNFHFLFSAGHCGKDDKMII